MSWYRKVKTIYNTTLTTIAFIIWSTLSKWILKNPVEYKLFFIALGVVFIAQYLSIKKLKKQIVISVSLAISILVSLIFLKNQAIFINTIFLLFMILITYSMRDIPIDHSKYKDDIKKSIIALVFIWLISFSQGIDFVNSMYKFNILYIIMIIILMRETRRYVYKVSSNSSMVTNLIIGISVITLSMDYASIIVSKVISLFMGMASFILSIIVTILSKIFGSLFAGIVAKMGVIANNQNAFPQGEDVVKDNFKDPSLMAPYEGIKLPTELILAFKILIIVLILYAMYKFLSRITSKARINTEFTEQKERIIRKRKKKHNIKELLVNLFKNGRSNKERILSKYKDIEKIAADVDIYKSYMTATELQDVIKININYVEDVDKMTQVYNEAKFSLHQMTEEQVELVKKAHINIKKQL